MQDRTTALRIVYGAIWVTAMASLFVVGGGLGLIIAIVCLVLATLLWPSVKPGVRTSTHVVDGDR